MGERLNGIQEVRGSIPLASIVGRLIRVLAVRRGPEWGLA